MNEITCHSCGRVTLFEGEPPADCPACGAAFDGGEPFDATSPMQAMGDVGRTMPGTRKASSGGGDPLVGRTIGGCVVDALLGRGAMGAVYRAYQTGFKRAVALKTIRPELAGDARLAERFQREVETIAKFNHENVVQVYHVGVEDDVHYLVMEYVDGGSLRDYAKKQPGGCISVDDALKFMRAACCGLRAAQSAGVLHRDIKPDNLILNEAGVLKLADFGIARVLQEDSNLTMTAELAGTPLYMSPEQCTGQELDFRSDMYSLGAAFYYLLSGRPPIEGSTSVYELIQTKAKLEKLSLDAVLDHASDAGPFGAVIERMTALEREDRYASYDDVLADLDRIERGQPVGALAAGSRMVERVDDAVVELRDHASQGPLKIAAILGVPLLLLAVVAWQMGWFSAGEKDGHADAAAQTQEDEVVVPADNSPVAPDLGKADRDELESGVVEVGESELTPDPPVEADPPVDVDPPTSDPPSNEPPETAPTEPDYQAELAALQTEFEGLVEEFVAKGPEAVASRVQVTASALESKSVEFDSLRDAFRALDRDVKRATGVKGDVGGMLPPVVALDNLEETANFVKTKREKAVLPDDATDAYKRWRQRALVTVFQREVEDLARSAERKLAQLWERCQTADSAVNIDALERGLEQVANAEAELAKIFPDHPFDQAAPPEGQAELSRMLAKFKAVRALADEIDAERERLSGVGLTVWLDEARRATQIRDGFRGRIDQVQSRIRSKFEVSEKLGLLDERLKFFDDSVRVLESAAGMLERADFAAIDSALDELGRKHRIRDVAEFKDLEKARRAMAAGHLALLVRLDVPAARREFASAKQAVAALPRGSTSVRRAETVIGKFADLAAQLGPRVATMAPVPGGRSTVGDEQVEVEPFFIDRTEVSRAQFCAFVKGLMDTEGLSRRLRSWVDRVGDGSLNDRPNHPIEAVSCVVAEECLLAMGRVLPTRAEWLIAALGPDGQRSKYPWGDTREPSRQQVNKESRAVEVADGGVALRFGTGAAAVHHLAGNVAEWSADGDGEHRYVMGGDYRCGPSQRLELAAGGARRQRPGERAVRVGFRGVVRPLELARRVGLPVTTR